MNSAKSNVNHIHIVVVVSSDSFFVHSKYSITFITYVVIDTYIVLDRLKHTKSSIGFRSSESVLMYYRYLLQINVKTSTKVNVNTDVRKLSSSGNSDGGPFWPRSIPTDREPNRNENIPIIRT